MSGLGPIGGMRGERFRLVVLVMLAVIISSAVGYGVSLVASGGKGGKGLHIPPSSLAEPPPPNPAVMRAEIVAAFGHIVGQPPSTAAIRPYVQGADQALSNALANGAVNGRSDAEFLLPDGIMHVSSINKTAPTLAVVGFSINDARNNYGTTRFVGTAIYSTGRWKVSWVTVCMLVEQEGVVCPNPPPGVATALPLPYSLSDALIASAQSPDLLRPSALALLADGDLLIVDSYRNQILQWHPNGDLTVFAGTGQPGFSGDGGPAIKARLDNLGGMAVAPNGIVYFVDGDRIRAISPNGIITTVAGNGESGPLSGIGGPAVNATLGYPSDVAYHDGTLYIADGQILKVSSAGIISTFFKGQAQGLVDTPGGMIGFDPAEIAFDGAGNLDVYNDGPRVLFRISPEGQLTDLGFAYDLQLTTAPDGTVFTAEHPEGVGEITASGEHGYINLQPLKIKGLRFPGDLPGLAPNGIAVAPSGVIYLDSFFGNGWSGGTSLVEITTHGTAQALPIRTPVLKTLPSPSSPGFSSTIYPNLVPAHGADLESCPNPRGLESFDAAAIKKARAIAAQFNAFTSSFYGDLQSSDRSWWKELFADWGGDGYDRDTHTVVSVQPASQDTFAGAVSTACGEKLESDSLVIDVGPSGYSFQVSHLYFLDRHGHPLIYFQAS